jgi:hypothetical protein
MQPVPWRKEFLYTKKDNYAYVGADVVVVIKGGSVGGASKLPYKRFHSYQKHTITIHIPSANEGVFRDVPYML